MNWVHHIDSWRLASMMSRTLDCLGWWQTAFAGHFVLAQLAPQDLNDYDDILAQLLQGTSLADARIGASLAEGLSTSLLQNRYGTWHTITHLQSFSIAQVMPLACCAD